jgi:ribosomal subunit interface protein
MQVPLTVNFHGVDKSDAIEARIREKIEALERFYDRITSCRVVVERMDSRHKKGNIYAVHIHLSVPGNDIVVGREPGRNGAHSDVYVALRDAFQAARRRLEDHVRRHRVQDVKPHALRQSGSVARLVPDEDYGFIAMPDGREAYFHRDSVIADGWHHLEVGSAVHFTEEEGEKGLYAANVSPRS